MGQVLPLHERPKSILRYPGAKWRIAEWIVDHFPPHDVYLEPFFGSGAVLFSKKPSRVETANDIDRRVVNLFRVIREHPAALAAAVSMTPYARNEYDASYGPETGDPVDDARRFLVRVWMANGGKFGCRCSWRHDMRGSRHGQPMPAEWRNLPDRLWAVVERLQTVHFECRPAVDVIAAAAESRILIYADPPYPRDTLWTRSARYYTHDLTDQDHHDLLDALIAHPGPVVLSGYRVPLYDDRLQGWTVVERPTIASSGAARTEVLWLNREAVNRRFVSQRSMFEVAS